MAYSPIWEAARRYLAAGFSLIPCKYKKPDLKTWQEYTVKQPTLREVNHWFEEWEQGQSIGVVLGAISHNVVVVDLDGMAAARLFKARFPQLADTKIVFSGSRTGFHLYFRVDELPTNMNVRVNDVGGFEIRGNGQYVIAPPSPHLAGFHYQLHKDLPIKPLANMNEVSEWLAALRDTNQSERQEAIVAASKPKQMQLNIPTEAKKRAFLQTVLSQEIARVETSSSGSRNQSLFYAGLRLANYAAAGELNWSDCERSLLSAAQSVSLPENEAAKTIASAWRIGSRNPKKVN